MADTPFEMPQLGETVTEGTILKWLKSVGESVELDEPLYEISTEKVDTEVPSPAGGILKEIHIKEGETVEVGTVLGVLDITAPAPDPDSDPDSAPAEPKIETKAPTQKPPAKKLTKKDSSKKLKVTSPVIRKLIRDSNIDKSLLIPTGKGGRVTRRDVELALAASNLVSQGNNKTDSALAPAIAQRFRTDQPTTTNIPLSKIRKATAEHMVRSKSVSPHVLTAVEVDFEHVERVRQNHRADFKEQLGISLTYLPFIARAVCDALAEYPHINASISAGEDGKLEDLVVHNYVNLGIAVDLDFEGLLAPVLKDADTKPLQALAEEIVDLANRARNKKLKPDELSGGTFTITNPGQYGTLMQFPIINQPQTAILSTDGIKRKPVVVKDADGEESISIHSVGILALAWDHRAFDGAYVAAFLDHLRTIIQNRDWEIEF